MTDVRQCPPHYWLCELGEDGKVPAVCKFCALKTIFEPKFIDGRSALGYGSNWVDMRLRTHGGTRYLSPRHSGAWSGDVDNAVKVLEG